LRPKSPFGNAVRKGFNAARENLPAMLGLEAVMAAVVAIYYCWPAGAAVLSRLGDWQRAGGVLSAAIATAIAGGLLSEFSVVYFQDGGRWTRLHAENAAFKFAMFFIGGALVYEFYLQQAVWFGHGAAWRVLVPKVLVDQFGYTVIWATPYQTLLTRWHALRYSFPRLGRELNLDFVTERMLPVLVANWMFWIPGVSLIYAMPTHLQAPLFILATAIWGLLLAAVAHPAREQSTGTVQDLVLPEPGATP
jgi:hypothetical protein